MLLFKRNKQKQEFSGWIKEHHAVIFKHALWLCGNKTLAADMVQDTYIQGWKSVNSLHDKHKVLPWLLTILRRIIYKEQREQYRHRETLHYLQNLELSDNNKQNTGEISLIDLYNIFEKISDAHREALLLYVLHGFTYEQISTQLEVPVGTVMSRISRARKAIKDYLESDSDNISHLNNLIK
ncbi:hypothetical protein MNBD_GAMMA12-1428 [hydrothermal vent metagenome]|uniref:RNA polymerase ECF-type sigma factor n=1 Tax=hydrothermal vent metagenome TaxID=652676 RepID=A0A3B0YRD7_9ZZZZ